ncbi:MAG: hypothetical protein ABSG55_04330 [Dehalococcoidia bacterium]|jgi:hypothetical protein
MQLRDGLTATAKTAHELHGHTGVPATLVIVGVDDDLRPFSLTLRDDEIIGLCAEAEVALGHQETSCAPRKLRG